MVTGHLKILEKWCKMFLRAISECPQRKISSQDVIAAVTIDEEIQKRGTRQ